MDRVPLRKESPAGAGPRVGDEGAGRWALGEGELIRTLATEKGWGAGRRG